MLPGQSQLQTQKSSLLINSVKNMFGRFGKGVSVSDLARQRKRKDSGITDSTMKSGLGESNKHTQSTLV